jgi:hypothetical protein
VRFLLTVDDLDLELLREHFDERPGSDVWFGKDNENGPYMGVNSVDADPDAASRQSAAKTLLTRAWGLLQLLEEPNGRAELSGTQIDSRGHKHTVVSPSSIVSVARMGRPTVLINGVPVEQPPSPALDLLALADSRPVVGEVFDLVGKSQLDWIDLYKVYEIVREEGGGIEGVEKKGWATKRKQSAFTASANRKDVSGDDARHARSQSPKTPRETMTIHEARVFIRGLAVDWLRHVSAASDFAE